LPDDAAAPALAPAPAIVVRPRAMLTARTSQVRRTFTCDLPGGFGATYDRVISVE